MDSWTLKRLIIAIPMVAYGSYILVNSMLTLGRLPYPTLIIGSIPYVLLGIGSIVIIQLIRSKLAGKTSEPLENEVKFVEKSVSKIIEYDYWNKHRKIVLMVIGALIFGGIVSTGNLWTFNWTYAVFFFIAIFIILARTAFVISIVHYVVKRLTKKKSV